MVTRTASSAAAWLILACAALGAAMPAVAADNPAAAEANLQLGVAYLKQNNLPIAKDKLERAREQNPRSSPIRTSLALLYERLGDINRADTEYKNALRLSPNDPDIQNNYAVYLCRNGRATEGVKRFEEAAANKLYRTPWAAYTNAGVCLRQAGKENEASQLFSKALTVRPSYSEAVVQLADLELAQKKPAAAYQHIDSFLVNNPASADLLLLGWRAAREKADQPNIDRLAKRLQTEFPNSDQARAVSNTKPNSG